MKPKTFVDIALRGLALCIAMLVQACTLSSAKVEPATSLGKPTTLAAMEALLDTPGPLRLDTVASADWTVPLAGLVNLKSPEAQRANLQDREEPIQIYAHVLQHPGFGAFLVDTGVSRQLLADPGKYGVHWLVRQFMPLHLIKVNRSAAEIVQQLPGKLQGVFLTHMHLDHITGMPDIDPTVPVYAGKGEATSRSLTNLFVQGPTDGVLAPRTALFEWNFPASNNTPLAGVADVFGDGSLFALHVPGHTPGSTAYVARTTQGAVLMVGDTSHTLWGWQNGVEPGSYTEDQPLNRQSLLALKALAQRHPQMQIRLGHQAVR